MNNTFLKSSHFVFVIVTVCMMGLSGVYAQGMTVKSVSYYLDAVSGNDSNDGRSKAAAWKTLERLKKIRLNPGDKVLFKRGTSYTGELEISAQGTEDAPVIIGAYGKGRRKPVLSAPDHSYCTVRILNSDYVTLQDLEIVNHGSTELKGRTGVNVACREYGVSRGIRLNNLTIRDVNGSLVKKDGGGSAINIQNGGKKISTFDGLTIEYCHIVNCQRNAIIWWGYSDRTNWHPNRNVVVRYNLIEKVPGDGIVPIGCDGAVIEYNVMRDCADTFDRNSSEAAAGIWPWSSDNTVIRYNEVSGHKAPWDSQGFDADYNCVNTVIEYNYSHDNYGGLVLMCSSGSEEKDDYCIGTIRPVVRYNISIGDGNRPYKTRGKMFSPSIHIGGPVRNGVIYRNIILNRKKAGPDIDRSMMVSDSWDGYASNTTVCENIFYTPETSGFDLTKSTGNRFEGNYYLGKYSSLPDEKNAGHLDEAHMKIIENTGRKGIMQFLDSVTIAANRKCVFVNKRKIEKFFNNIP